MREFTRKRLADFLQNKDFHKFKKRICFEQLTDYLEKGDSSKVCLLYGLRRTGKTVMMYQAIEESRNLDECLYIYCSNGDTMESVCNAIEANPQCKYIFVDEITKVEDFVDMAGVLSDVYAGKNKKIVLAGTDSLGFAIAKENELLDRVKMVHTTYIPYREYALLLGKDLFNYMKYGGTLAEENVFYNEDSLDEYTNSAIVKNILHTVKYWDMGKNDILCTTKEEDLSSFINRLLQRDSKLFVAETLSEKFKVRDLGSVKQMLEKKERINKKLSEEKRENLPASAPLKEENLRLAIMNALFVKEGGTHELPENEETLRILTKYLQVLDVVKKEPGTERFYFLQPGMRYCHIEAIVQSVLQNTPEYSQADKELVCTKVLQDVEGRLLEDIAYMELQDIFKENNSFKIWKYRNGLGSEFDIVISNKENGNSVVFEVKRDFEANGFQSKHLNNQDFCVEFEEECNTHIVGKAVLYSGESGKHFDTTYLNLSLFLQAAKSHIKAYFPELLTNISKEQDQKQEFPEEPDR